MSSKSIDKKRKWILSLGFSEAEADSFIEFEVPNLKIEALAEVLHPPEPEGEPEKSEKEAEEAEEKARQEAEVAEAEAKAKAEAEEAAAEEARQAEQKKA